MRCAKCGKRLMYNIKVCPFCGEPVSAVQRKKAIIQLVTLGILVALTLVSSLLFIYYDKAAGVSAATRNFYLYFFTSSLAALMVFCFAVIIIDYVEFFIRRPVWGSIILAVILLSAFCGYLFYRQYKFDKDLPAVLTVIQDQLGEAMAAKIMGDSIVANRPVEGASMIRVGVTSQQAANRLARLRKSASVPKRLSGYLDVAIDWARDVAAAARNEKEWGALGAEPGDFPLDLSDSQARKLVKVSAEKISALEEFADTAMARGDRDTMRYIAAKFLVQKHWLEGIVYSTKSWHSFLVLGAPVLAREKPMVYQYEGAIRKICILPEPPTSGQAFWVCAQDLALTADRLGKAAIDFAKGDEETVEETKKEWKETKEDTKKNLPPSQTGTAKSSPAVQDFYNDCDIVEGKIGSTYLKKDLPTDLGGYTCEYKYGDLKCWDFLSFAGGKYMGGEEGCPTLNLPPPAPEPGSAEAAEYAEEETAPEAEEAENFDGTYPYSVNMNCAGNIPNLPSSVPVNGTITVSNNVGIDDNISFNIDSKGNAIETVQYDETFDAATQTHFSGSTVIFYHFSKAEDGSNMFTAYAVSKLVLQVGDKSYSSSCAALVVVPEEKASAPTSAAFDGFYVVNYDTSCTVSPSVGCGSPWSTTGGETYFSVTNNMARDAYGTESRIDEAGNAVMVREESYGSHKVTYVTNLHFSKSGGKVTITGTDVSTDISGSCTETCTHTFTKTR